MAANICTKAHSSAPLSRGGCCGVLLVGVCAKVLEGSPFVAQLQSAALGPKSRNQSLSPKAYLFKGEADVPLIATYEGLHVCICALIEHK